MRVAVFLSLGLALLMMPTLSIAGPPQTSQLPDQWQRGIAYVAYAPGLYSSPDSDRSLELLAATGANWISLTVTCYQASVYSTVINCLTDAQTPTDADLMHVLGKAHSLGLKVMLKPSLNLLYDQGHWFGEIGIGFDEAAWAQWFSSYRSFILHHAQLAQTTGFDQLSVGAELSGTTDREADWRSVIAAVRAVYSGPLTYAANFGGEEIAVQFWDALDLIGVDAYYPLTDKMHPSVDELKAGWLPHLQRLQALSQRWKRPIIFPELGYRSVAGANMRPYDWRMDGQVDLPGQADLYQAFFEVFHDQPWMNGVFWWAWGPDPNQGGPDDTYYSPHNKMAEGVLRFYFKAPLVDQPPSPPNPPSSCPNHPSKKLPVCPVNAT
jgi:hypothetical protein